MSDAKPTNGNPQSSTASRYRELLANDPKMALELAITESERAKARIAESRSVQLDRNGQFIVRSLDGLMTLGNILAHSQMVPERFAGKVNDCALGAHMAIQLGMHPITVLQSMYVVYGNPGFDAKFAIALISVRGGIDGIIQYEHDGAGDEQRCRAWVRLKGQPEKIYGPWVTAAMVKGEGWDKAKGEKKVPSKWTYLTELMYEYRSATFLMRTRFPHLLMGLRTVDELEDIHGVSLDDESGAVVEESAAEVRVKVAPPIVLPTPAPPEPTPAEHPKSERLEPEPESPETTPPQFSSDQTSDSIQTKPDAIQTESGKPAESETPPIVPPQEATFAEYAGKLKMVRTAAGVESLVEQIHAGRTAMTGAQYESLLEQAEGRRFEIERRANGKQRGL